MTAKNFLTNPQSGSVLAAKHVNTTMDARGGRPMPAPHAFVDMTAPRDGILTARSDTPAPAGGFRGRKAVVVDRLTGKRARGRIPAVGHSDDKQMHTAGAPVELSDDGRCVELVKADGNIVHAPISNGAGHVSTPDDGTYRYLNNKALALGWFMPTACAARLVKQGQLDLYKCATVEDLKDAKVCSSAAMDKLKGKACPHTIAEILARRAKHAAKDADNEQTFKSVGQKQHEEAVEKNNRLVELLEKAFAGKDKG